MLTVTLSHLCWARKLEHSVHLSRPGRTPCLILLPIPQFTHTSLFCIAAFLLPLLGKLSRFCLALKWNLIEEVGITPLWEITLTKRQAWLFFLLSFLLLEILVLMCLRHHSKAIHEPPAVGLCSSFWSHLYFGFLNFQQQEAPWTNCAFSGQEHNKPNNAYTDGVLALLPSRLSPPPAADSHGRDTKQPMQAQTPRAEHMHRRLAKSLDPTSHSVLVCSQLLLLYCKHKSEKGEGTLSSSVLCSGTTAVTELTPMPVLSLPLPQPFPQCFL